MVRSVTECLQTQYQRVHNLAHGHVAAALGMLCLLKPDTIISKRPTRVRNIVLALIVSPYPVTQEQAGHRRRIARGGSHQQSRA